MVRSVVARVLPGFLSMCGDIHLLLTHCIAFVGLVGCTCLAVSRFSRGRDHFVSSSVAMF